MVFGGKKKKQEALARLTAAIGVGRAALTSTDPTLMRESSERLRERASQAEVDYGHEAYEVARSLERRITDLREAAMKERLRACGVCGGRDFRLSEELAIELRLSGPDSNSPKMRMLLCTSCGELRFLLARMEDLESSSVLLGLFSTKLRAPDDARGPFR